MINIIGIVLGILSFMLFTTLIFTTSSLSTHSIISKIVYLPDNLPFDLLAWVPVQVDLVSGIHRMEVGKAAVCMPAWASVLARRVLQMVDCILGLVQGDNSIQCPAEKGRVKA